jgi:hypothetical protein
MCLPDVIQILAFPYCNVEGEKLNFHSQKFILLSFQCSFVGSVQGKCLTVFLQYYSMVLTDKEVTQEKYSVM